MVNIITLYKIKGGSKKMASKVNLIKVGDKEFYYDNCSKVFRNCLDVNDFITPSFLRLKLISLLVSKLMKLSGINTA